VLVVGGGRYKNLTMCLCFTSHGLICYILLALECKVNDLPQGRQGQHSPSISSEFGSMTVARKSAVKETEAQNTLVVFKY